MWSTLQILLCTVGISLSHPLHVSVTEIEYDRDEKELEIMVRIFSDDLEQGIRREKGQDNIDILNPPSGTSTDDLVQNYIMKKLQIKLDGKLMTTQYLGSEKEGEALICYIQVAKVKDWKTIEVTNTLLTEMFDNQTNLVHVTLDKKVKSMRLGYHQLTDKLTF